ncbi:hypothetical protein TWF696_000280 [Orbilia brochopaga]|uniref:NFX1-type zinc finger-containing protein 1 n=1 Tax=Orbilia brochopaga TaxID=3140254 RepID=A0AAV9VC21_9PEZI
MSTQSICFEWRNGSCQRGTTCRYAHDEASVPPCQHFLRRGNCRWGAKCKHGHPTSTSMSQTQQSTAAASIPTYTPQRRMSTSSSTSTTQQPQPPVPQNPLQSWRRFCRIRGLYTATQMKTFLDGALRFIQEKNVENQQQVIKELADGENLEHIRQLLEADLPYDGAGNNLTFVTHAILLLRIITNSEFQGSIVVEKYAGTVYNVIYGNQGARGIPFFERLLSRSRTLMGNNPELYIEVFPMVVSALRSTIQLNSNAVVQDGIKRIARDALAQANEQSLLVNPDMRQLHQDFKVINEQLNLGERIPSLIPHRAGASGNKAGTIFNSLASWLIGGGKGVAHPNLHPAVQATARLPGELSDLGPRHDNDHASITDIRILPTAEEIRSVESEYLPRLGGDSLHLDRNQRLLDSQFRLLREDSIGGLRESLRQIIDNRFNLDNLQRGRRRRNDGVKRFSSAGIPVLIHQNAMVEEITFNATSGLKVNVSFNQPIPSTSLRERNEWWRSEHILEFNALVCILNEWNEAVFFTVSDRYVTSADIRHRDEEAEERNPNGPIKTLAEHPLRAGIVLSFADTVREKDVDWLYRLAASRDISKNDLVEFPKVLLASFRPILQGLQKRLKKTQAIPFIDWLAPDPDIDFQRDTTDTKYVAVRPPPYAAKGQFSFELSPVFSDGYRGSLRLFPTSDEFDMKRLLDHTTLDDGQARSLVRALSREVALIQGPPGTGKSFIGTKLVKVLLRQRRLAELGPIICVCYTNHALDQFLEHLLDDNIKGIIRLGSRSKSEKLEPYLLKNLSKAADNTRVEKSEIWELKKETRKLREEALAYCDTLTNADSERTLKTHLTEHYPQLVQPLFYETADEEGFVVHRGRERPFVAWRQHARPAPPGAVIRSVQSILDTLRDPWTLNPWERYALLVFWQQEMVHYATTGLAAVTEKHRVESEKLSTMKKEYDRRLLQNADIIGVTTTSLAMHADVLERIQAKVLFCEEAGEILEAHTITTLIPSIEHMILIGDHEQLRPHIANFDLSIESQKGQSYMLDVSLFERLTRQPYGSQALEFPIASLNTQRRMHPSIADLIRLKTYPELLDKVPDYPAIPGMKKRLYWMDHAHPDSKGDAVQLTTSYENEFERDMVAALVTHLLRQGAFREKQIAVLTPYLGQMKKLRRLLGSSFDIVIGSRDQEALDAEGLLDDEEEEEEPVPKETRQAYMQKTSLSSVVRIATIDNFQGEEADVVIISLVRSNKERQCGFLKTSNRINVLLSRAKWGMYIIGNADTASSVPMWATVINHMTLGGCLGNALELECERHKDFPIYVASKEDFLISAPEGGCSNRCEWRLPCGHACVAKCHAAAIHELAPCFEPCPKALTGCDHPCVSKCGQPCAPCEVPFEGVLLRCGHIAAELKCWEVQKLDSYQCQEKVEKEVPSCKHKIKVECHKDVSAKSYRCPARCGAILNCGHICQRLCRDCRKPKEDAPGEFTINHNSCLQTCERPFNTCSHSCVKLCHGDEPCGFCEQDCEVRCAHSHCSNRCKDPCPPCAEACTLGCEHQKCLMPCGVSCNILPCDQPCPKQLECGHPCPSICGEKCPERKYCRECAPDEVLNFEVDMLMFETYRESKDEPIIFLPCNHFYTVSTFDGVAKMRDFFEFEDSESWKITKRYLDEKSEPQLPRCPKCRQVFTTSTRYNEVVKKAQLQNCIRRFTAASHDRLRTLISAVDLQQDALELSRKTFVPKDLKDAHARYDDLSRVQRRIQAYNKEVLREEQPYHRVYELTVFACRTHNIHPGDYNPTIVQYRFGIEGAYQEIRAKLLEICDMDILAGQLKPDNTLKPKLYRRVAMSAKNTMRNCDRLVDTAKSRSYNVIEIQARIARAKLVTLLVRHNDELADKTGKLTTAAIARMREETFTDLEQCKAICRVIPSCAVLEKEVDSTIRTVRGGVFYSAVSDEEMKEVYKAMAAQFLGTGHWYVCPNGHQFTIGECGMAMQLGRCNECGAQIGGQNHTSVQGVRRDEDLENRMANIRVI